MWVEAQPQSRGASWMPESRSTWDWEPLTARACPVRGSSTVGLVLGFFVCLCFLAFLFFFLNSFIKKEFTYHTIHLLEVLEIY